MSQKTIPARLEIQCDSCGVFCSGTPNGNRAQDGKLIVHQHALDMHSQPCADGTVTFDLCDNCLGCVIKVVNAEFTRIRESRA